MKVLLTIGYHKFYLDIDKEDTGNLFNTISEIYEIDGYSEPYTIGKRLDVQLEVFKQKEDDTDGTVT